MNPGNSELPASSTASLRTALAEIDAELAALRARVEELAAARKPIVDALKSIVYPILTIPGEITAEIFLQCVDWVEISRFSASALQDPLVPLVLAGVCKQWRAVALNLQPVWSRLRIGLYDSHITQLEALLGWWLPRAGGRLLEVDMTSSEAEVIMAFIPHSARWRTLTCDFSSGLRYPSGLATIKGRIPHLEKLCIGLPRGAVPTKMMSIFSEAPLLRELHVTGLTSDSFVLPWGQLTTLGLVGKYAAMYAEVLRRTPQLQRLSLEPGGGAFGAPQTAVTLHHLHTLEIRGNHGDQDAQLLDALILPALRHLELGVCSEEFEDKALALLSRSSCSLASVSFRSPSLDLYFLMLIHKAARTCTEIHITDVDWTAAEIRSAFVNTRGSRTVLPSLRTLSMSSRSVDLPYAAMAKMLASRQGSEEGCTRLESFRLTLPQLTPVEHDVFAMFGALTAEGCRIDIRGLSGFNIGSNSAAHSYTLEPSYQTF